MAKYIMNNVGVFYTSAMRVIVLADARTENGFIVGRHPLEYFTIGHAFDIPHDVKELCWDNEISFNCRNVLTYGMAPLELAEKFSERAFQLIEKRRLKPSEHLPYENPHLDPSEY